MIYFHFYSIFLENHIIAPFFIFTYLTQFFLYENVSNENGFSCIWSGAKIWTGSAGLVTSVNAKREWDQRDCSKVAKEQSPTRSNPIQIAALWNIIWMNARTTSDFDIGWGPLTWTPISSSWKMSLTCLYQQLGWTSNRKVVHEFVQVTYAMQKVLKIRKFTDDFQARSMQSARDCHE